MKSFLLIILALVLFQCGNPQPDSIEIVVKDNTFTVNGDLVAADSLEFILKLEKKKFGDQQPTIMLMVDPDTKRGKLSDLETILRKLNLRKIHYLKSDRTKAS